MSNDIGRELGWDDAIENDGSDYVTLPAGDYDFEVIDFERGRHGGGGKLPACNKAVLTIRCEGKEGVSTIKHNLFLHTKTEGLLCSFFASIGQRKKGQRVNMDWGKVVGATGRCQVGIRNWTNDQGEEKVFNEIKRFHEYDAPNFKPGQF